MLEKIQRLLYQEVVVKEIVTDEIRRAQSFVIGSYYANPAYVMARSLEILDESGCKREVIFWSSKYEIDRLNDVFAFYDWSKKSKEELKNIPIKSGTILKINKFTGSTEVKRI